jgi:hypothetical protein
MLMLYPGSARNLLRNSASYTVCAHDRRNNKYVITNAGSSVWTAITLEPDHCSPWQKPEIFACKRRGLCSKSVDQSTESLRAKLSTKRPHCDHRLQFSPYAPFFNCSVS